MLQTLCELLTLQFSFPEICHKRNVDLTGCQSVLQRKYVEAHLKGGLRMQIGYN